MLEAGQFTLGPCPRTRFFAARPVEEKLGEEIDYRDSSLSSRSRQPGSTLLDKYVMEFLMPLCSIVTTVVIVEKKNESRMLAEGQA